MSYLSSFSQNLERNAYDNALRGADLTPEEPGVFQGLGSADTYTNALGTMAGQAQVTGGLALSTLARPMGEDYQEYWFKNAVDPGIERIKANRLDPLTHGIAAQVVNGLASFVPEAMLTGPVGVGVLSGLPATAEHLQGGKDLTTASELGGVEGVAATLGAMLPGGIGKTLTQKVVTGAIGFTGFGMANRAATHEILDNAGYHDEANQVNWQDGKAMLVDAIMGAAFGGIHHAFKPSDADAALTVSEGIKAEASAPGEPVDIAAATEHARALNESIDNLVNGEDVNVNVNPDQYRITPEPVIEKTYHPGISALASDLQEGGGIAYTFDQHGKINGRTPSLNPDWYKDGSFKIFGKNGDELSTTPTVKEIKKAVSAYENGEKLTSRQERILQSLSDTAHYMEQDHYDMHQANFAVRLEHMLDKARSELKKEDYHDYLNSVERGSITPDNIHEYENEIDNIIYEERSKAADAELGRNQEQSTRSAQAENTNISSELQSAKDYLETRGDLELPYYNEHGEEQTAKLSDLIKESQQDMTDDKNLDNAMQSAITCFLRFGDAA